MTGSQQDEIESENPLLKRAALISSIESYSLYQLSVGESARLGFQDGASEPIQFN